MQFHLKMSTFHETYSSNFLRELEKYETEPEEVGCSFTVWVDLLYTLYTTYCVNKEQKINVLQTADVLAFFGVCLDFFLQIWRSFKFYFV